MESSAHVEEISQYIATNASRYFPKLNGDEVKVRLLEEQYRSFSSLYRFEVSSGRANYKIYAKGIPLAEISKPDESTKELRPRIAPPGTNYRERLWLEYTALKAVSDYLEKLDDPALGGMRILDFIQSPQTILMEEHTDPSLRLLMSRTNRMNHVRGRSTELLKAFFNAGAWLKAYSTISNTENVTTRNSHRDEFKQSVVDFTEYLGRVSGNAPFFNRVEQTVTAAAKEFMPEDLALGLGHGDYALRNILVGTNNRITAFDTCAKWRVPIYEDIAYFLVQLETNKLQVVTQGYAIHTRTMAAYQREFLAGYFGRAHIPIEIVQLFHIQLLLDSWSSQTTIYTKSHAGMKKAYGKFYLALLNRRYRIIMEGLLNELSMRPSE